MSEYRKLITPSTTADVIKALQARVDELERQARRAVGDVWLDIGRNGGPAWQNSWAAWDSYRYVRAYRDRGRVWMEGIAGGSGSLGQTIFTLPDGWRPYSVLGTSIRVLHPVATGHPTNGEIYGSLSIYGDGRVQLSAGGTQWLSFEGVSFRVAS